MTLTEYHFGDAEPEDAWDAGDPMAPALENLARRLARFGITTILEGDVTVRAELVRRWELLNVLAVELERRPPAFPVYLEMIRADLETLRRRLEAVAGG